MNYIHFFKKVACTTALVSYAPALSPFFDHEEVAQVDRGVRQGNARAPTLRGLSCPSGGQDVVRVMMAAAVAAAAQVSCCCSGRRRRRRRRSASRRGFHPLENRLGLS